MLERVVITGIGCVSCFGVGQEAFSDGVRSGRSGIAPISAFATTECRARSAAMLRDFIPEAFIPPLKLRRIDSVGRIALASAKLLMEDASIGDNAQRTDMGMALGTYTAGLDSLVEYLDALTLRGPAAVPAILFSNTVANAPASHCAIEFNLHGPNATFNQREASSLSAVAFAVDAVQQGRAPGMVAGGADCLTELFFKVYDRLGALSPARGRSDEEGARPFDRNRNGVTLGEGGFLLLLERVSSAEARGARIYGDILGVGASASKTSLNGWTTSRGLAAAMTSALRDASIDHRDVAAIVGTSNGSPDLDREEALAIVEVFGEGRVPVPSIKGAVGESGAAGAAGVIAGLMSLRKGCLMPSAGLKDLDPDLHVCASGSSQSTSGDVFMVNSSSIGGTNYSVVVRART